MKISLLIRWLEDVRRSHGDVDIIMYDSKNEEWDIDHVDTGWSPVFRHTYAVICTGNHEKGSEPQEECDPPEREPYTRGELPPRDSRDEHDRTLGPAYE